MGEGWRKRSKCKKILNGIQACWLRSDDDLRISGGKSIVGHGNKGRAQPNHSVFLFSKWKIRQKRVREIHNTDTSKVLILHFHSDVNLHFWHEAHNLYSMHCVWTVYKRVNGKNKLHLDYDEPLDQYNIVRGCRAIFHRKFHWLEYWMAAWSNPDVKYIGL